MHAPRSPRCVILILVLLSLVRVAPAEMLVQLQRFVQRDPPRADRGQVNAPGGSTRTIDPPGLQHVRGYPEPPGDCRWEMPRYWPPWPVLVCVSIDTGWCRDSLIGGAMHPGETCFRQVTPDCEPSDHICCHPAAGGGSECSKHRDSAGPAVGGSGGTCEYGPYCACLHLVKDVIPALPDWLCNCLKPHKGMLLR